MGVIKWQEGADPKIKDAPEVKDISKLPGKDILPALMTQIYNDLGDKDFISLIIASITAVLGMHRTIVKRAQKEARGSESKAVKEKAQELKIGYNKFVRSIKKTLVDKIDSMAI